MTLEIAQVAVPSFGYPPGTHGRNGEKITAIVDHIGEGWCHSFPGLFMNPENFKSSNYVVCFDGSVTQFVDDADAAWANGIDYRLGYQAYLSDMSMAWIRDCWDREVSPNLMTLSIEHEGFTGNHMPEPQYQATLALHAMLIDKYRIPNTLTGITGHFSIDARMRKRCPGAGFPWGRLYRDLGLRKLADRDWLGYQAALTKIWDGVNEGRAFVPEGPSTQVLDDIQGLVVGEKTRYDITP